MEEPVKFDSESCIYRTCKVNEVHNGFAKKIIYEDFDRRKNLIIKREGLKFEIVRIVPVSQSSVPMNCD